MNCSLLYLLVLYYLFTFYFIVLFATGDNRMVATVLFVGRSKWRGSVSLLFFFLWRKFGDCELFLWESSAASHFPRITHQMNLLRLLQEINTSYRFSSPSRSSCNVVKQRITVNHIGDSVVDKLTSRHFLQVNQLYIFVFLLHMEAGFPILIYVRSFNYASDLSTVNFKATC